MVHKLTQIHTQHCKAVGTQNHLTFTECPHVTSNRKETQGEESVMKHSIETQSLKFTPWDSLSKNEFLY